MKKLIITSKQLKNLLVLPDIHPKYPITVKMKNISKTDLEELIILLKKKK